MINILSICNSSSVVNIIYIVKVVLTVITVAVPIVLILSCLISVVRLILSKDLNFGSMFRSWSIKIIAALLVFFIPNFVFSIGRVITGSNEVKSCYQSASLSRVNSLKASEKAQAEAKVKAWQQEQEKLRKEAEEKKKKEEEEKEKKRQEELKKILGKLGGSNGSSANEGPDAYNTGYDKNGNAVYSVNLKAIDTTKYAVPVSSGIHGELIRKNLRFNAEIASEADILLSKVAVFVKNSPYVDYLQTAGAYVGKAGYHGKGLAIDIFNRYQYKYTNSNGKTVTFTPYGKQGTSEWNNRYKKFICTVCNGNEACPENINYHIYYDIFKPAKWCWGGNWRISYFDPMHFERTNGGCSTAPKNRITPESCK